MSWIINSNSCSQRASRPIILEGVKPIIIEGVIILKGVLGLKIYKRVIGIQEKQKNK